MLRWSIEVFENGKSAKLLDMPGTIEKAQVMDLMRLIVAKSLTYSEIAGCIWSEHYGRLEFLDIQHYDEGRTLACGAGLLTVYARQMVRAPKGCPSTNRREARC